MTRGRTAVAVGLAVTALALAGCGGSDDEATETDTGTATTVPGTVPETGDVLKGTVGPGFDISLTTEDGAAVETLPVGSYTLIVDDKADAHNFHLTGDGVDVSTEVGELGTDTFDVDLTSGTYTFVCDPHASSMNGSVEVS
jgi:plastocyanin